MAGTRGSRSGRRPFWHRALESVGRSPTPNCGSTPVEAWLRGRSCSAGGRVRTGQRPSGLAHGQKKKEGATLSEDHSRVPFVPVERMRERTRLARDESDTSYFFDLLYMGEMLLKIVVADLVAAIDDDRDHNRYALECRLVRADGVGEWADVLDEVLTGPPSQLLIPAARETQRELSMNVGPEADTWQRRAVDRLNDACRCLDEGIPGTATQKTSFRQWGRSFAWLRNRTRGHGAPKAATLSSVCPALADSLDALIEGVPTFGRDWVHLSQTLSGKYRVSCFGGQREPFSYLSREAGHSLHDGVYVALPAPRPVALFLADSDLSDFFLPNGNFRKQRFEAISYITDETRAEDGTEWAMPIEARPLSETTAQPDLDLLGEVFSNMPPKREGYVSRPALEGDLRVVLTDERNPVVTLQGRGGVGKTSLALEVLHGLSNTQDFFAVVWFSARDIDLLQDGPKVVRADILSTEDVAKEFAGLMRPNENLKTLEALQSLPTDANGAAVFPVTPTSNGTYQVVVPPADNRLEGVSVPYAISVQSQVNALPKQVRIPRGGKLVVKAVLVPGIDGLQLLEKAQQIDAGLPVILVTGHGDISMAVQAMRLGAYDFIEKPFAPERLADAVGRACEKRYLTLRLRGLHAAPDVENRSIGAPHAL